MSDGPARRDRRWVLVLFAGLLMTLAAAANLAWMLASVGAFEPLAAALAGTGWVAYLAALLVPVVVGMAGAFLWYTVRWRAVLAADDPADRARLRARGARPPLSMAVGAILLAVAAHGSFYWAGNSWCRSVALCVLFSLAAVILGNLFAAAAGAIGLVLVGDGAEAPLSLVLLVPATLVTPFWAMATVNAPVLGRLVNTTGVACLLVVLVRLARVRPRVTRSA